MLTKGSWSNYNRSLKSIWHAKPRSPSEQTEAVRLRYTLSRGVILQISIAKSVNMRASRFSLWFWLFIFQYFNVFFLLRMLQFVFLKMAIQRIIQTKRWYCNQQTQTKFCDQDGLVKVTWFLTHLDKCHFLNLDFDEQSPDFSFNNRFLR